MSFFHHCCILLNILLCQFHKEVEELLQVLRNEGLDGAVVDDDGGGDAVGGDGADALAREDLGVFLTLQRRGRH
ncbi:hypothetical protein M758_UG274200 [Ceratodon purpureus]|nr:hypothetical protein M758_UG274200 [Ceratodon purpureus]